MIFTVLDIQILSYLRTNTEGVTRSFLGQELDTPRTTLYDHLQKLEDVDLIKRYPFNHGHGRPWTIWCLND